jgi:hypothetical protein
MKMKTKEEYFYMSFYKEGIEKRQINLQILTFIYT